MALASANSILRMCACVCGSMHSCAVSKPILTHSPEIFVALSMGDDEWDKVALLCWYSRFYSVSSARPLDQLIRWRCRRREIGSTKENVWGREGKTKNVLFIFNDDTCWNWYYNLQLYYLQIKIDRQIRKINRTERLTFFANKSF